MIWDLMVERIVGLNQSWREVNRGMKCRSNRLEECEQLSTPSVHTGTSRIKLALKRVGAAAAEHLLFIHSCWTHFCFFNKMSKRPPFCCPANLYSLLQIIYSLALN